MKTSFLNIIDDERQRIYPLVYKYVKKDINIIKSKLIKTDDNIKIESERFYKPISRLL